MIRRPTRLLPTALLCVAAILCVRAAAVLSIPTVASQETGACRADLAEVGRLGGYTTAFTLSGDLAYFGMGRFVRIVDVGPGAMTGATGAHGVELPEVGAVALPGDVSHLAVVSGTLLVGLGDLEELQAFDVTEPTAPQPLGRLAVPGSVQALAVQGPVAFVGLGYDILTVDIADPARMEVVHEIQVPHLDIYHWFVLYDGLLFIPGAGFDQTGLEFVHGLRVLDVRDPLAPRDLGCAALDPRPYDIAFVGDIAYVAAYGSGVRTYDMSDPLVPKLLGVVETPRGGLHYVVSDGRYAYGLGDWRAVYVADVRDPSQPVHVGIVDVPGGPPHRPALAGNWLAAASDGAFHVLDVADPPTLTLRAAFHTVGTSDGGIAVRDGRAYVGTVEGLRSIDLRDPGRPRDDGGVLERFPPSEVQLVGSRAYVAGGYFTCCGTVSILDLADAAHPRTLGTVSVVGNPYSMAVREPYLFVSSVDSDLPRGGSPWDGSRFFLYNVRDPAAPGERIEIPHAGTLLSVADLVYVFDGELLRVLDVGPDGVPVTVSSQAFADSIHAANLVGNHVYAADSERLHVLDVSDTRSPVVVGAIEGVGGSQMAADGACLFALREAGSGTNVQVVALDDPARPHLVTTIRGVGGIYGPNGVAADGQRVYLASELQGLVNLAPPGLARPTAWPTTPPPTATPWPYRLTVPLALDASEWHTVRR